MNIITCMNLMDENDMREKISLENTYKYMCVFNKAESAKEMNEKTLQLLNHHTNLYFFFLPQITERNFFHFLFGSVFLLT